MTAGERTGDRGAGLERESGGGRYFYFWEDGEGVWRRREHIYFDEGRRERHGGGGTCGEGRRGGVAEEEQHIYLGRASTAGVAEDGTSQGRGRRRRGARVLYLIVFSTRRCAQVNLELRESSRDSEGIVRAPMIGPHTSNEIFF